ncbi:MAG: hypothetical protein KAU83_11375, partial [Bacteroidales bacterium]|nr:hypothetical protein [Bacteroidales bacterium]
AIEKKVEEIVYPLPTSFEVTNMLNDIGIPYIIGISNPVENADRYFTEKSKALNLGVYGADLSYASTYHMKQDVMLFLEASKKLTDDLEISAVYDEELIKKVEENINNKEELVDIITNSFYEVYEYLQKNDRANLSLVIVVGSWIEALYLTTHVSTSVYHNYNIVKIIHEQKSSLNNLINILQEYKDDKAIFELLQDLDPIKKVYDSIDESLTQEQVEAIILAIESVRDKIVS